MQEDSQRVLRLALPTGRMQGGVTTLLAAAGIEVRSTARDYRPAVSLADVEAKFLKPQNIIEMLAAGSRDLGFAGADWVEEKAADLVEVLDTGLDPVEIVAAAPRGLLVGGRLPARPLRVASEYEGLTRRWVESQGIDAVFVRSYGATEVFPPEDADVIVDNRATGSTLEANGLEIVDSLALSSTRLYASPQAWEEPGKLERIEAVRMVVASVLEARRRVMLEVNATPEALQRIVGLLPSMREATVAPLFGETGFAVKAAVPRSVVPELVPALKRAGGSDVAITSLEQIVP